MNQLNRWIAGNAPILLAGAVYVFLAGCAEAQLPTEEQVEHFREQLEEGYERLNLSPEQEEAMEALAEKLATESMAILRAHGIEPTEPWPALDSETIRGLRDEITELNEENEAALAEILTDEQLAMFREIRAEAVEEIRPENPR